MAINCCKGCVAPKRYPGCHGQCPEYIAQKAEYDKRRDEYMKQSDINNAIRSSRSDKVYKAMRDRKRT